MAPADPILSLSESFKNDTCDKKVNLGVGAYRDEQGKPFVFPVVKKAQLAIANDPKLDLEYGSIDGNALFNKAARGVLFGWDHPDVNSRRVASA